MRSNHIHGHVGCQTIRLRTIAQPKLVPDALPIDFVRSAGTSIDEQFISHLLGPGWLGNDSGEAPIRVCGPPVQQFRVRSFADRAKVITEVDSLREIIRMARLVVITKCQIAGRTKILLRDGIGGIFQDRIKHALPYLGRGITRRAIPN